MSKEVEASAEAHDEREAFATFAWRGKLGTHHQRERDHFVKSGVLPNEFDAAWHAWQARAALTPNVQPKGMLPEPIYGPEYEAGNWSRRNYEAFMQDQGTQSPAPAPEKPLPAELGEWLTAIGELYIAMGRPKFEATEPTLGVVETLREAAKRLAAASPAVAHEPLTREQVYALLPQRLRSVEFAASEVFSLGDVCAAVNAALAASKPPVQGSEA